MNKNGTTLVQDLSAMSLGLGSFGCLDSGSLYLLYPGFDLMAGLRVITASSRAYDGVTLNNLETVFLPGDMD